MFSTGTTWFRAVVATFLHPFLSQLLSLPPASGPCLSLLNAPVVPEFLSFSTTGSWSVLPNYSSLPFCPPPSWLLPVSVSSTLAWAEGSRARLISFLFHIGDAPPSTRISEFPSDALLHS